jgi:hypothetical protein
MAAPLLNLQRSIEKDRRRKARLLVVHRKSRMPVATSTIAPGVEAMDVERFVKELGQRE